MIKKLENCLYCGQKMESKTAKKRFCSDAHRVYWNREKSIEKILELNKEEIDKVAADIVNLGMGVYETDGLATKRVNPLSPEVSTAIYNATHTDSQMQVKEVPASEFNSSIEAQIKAIQAEKIPPERNTSLGKRIWHIDQNKRIAELKNKMQ